MKRSASALAQITYGSSEDEDDLPPVVPRQKKRRLPSLSEGLKVIVPKDDPSKHQGRIRTTPHVDGQYAAHVYVPIHLSARDRLNVLLNQVLETAKADIHGVQEMPNAIDEKGGRTLHVSLSRPIYLRAHQKDDLKRAVKGIATSHVPFKVSFTTFSQFTNDEHTRIFLAIRVGAGHPELAKLANDLNVSPIFSILRQKPYYTDAKFHASVAWSLLERVDSNAGASPSPPTSIAANVEPKPELKSPVLLTPTHPSFPSSLLLNLDDLFALKLTRMTFDIAQIRLKIGKDDFGWDLSS